MGEVRAICTIANGLDSTIVPLKVDALVDSGAVMPMLGRDIVDKLGVTSNRKAVVTLADDSKCEMDVAGPIAITFGDRIAHMDCLVGPVGAEPLLGQIVMEMLDLVIDCQHRTLTVRPESPAYPSYKLK
ncbi:MAG: clan AA aspartic protease [Gammaproteobacteria bacterium]